MQKIFLENKVILPIFILLLFIDLYYLFNRDWFVFIPLVDDSITIASITRFSWVNNLYFIIINVALFFILFLFIHKNLYIFNFKESTYLSTANLFLIISIIIMLSLPYSNPIRIGNFGDVFHDSEKIAFIPYIYNSFNRLEIINNVFTLHGWFQDLYISMLSYWLYGYEKIIFGLRSITSFVHTITALTVILLIYSFVKNLIKSEYYTFILFLTFFAILQYSNLTSIIDRQLFLYLILIVYLNFNFEDIKSRKNYIIISISAVLIIASFFYNFYQFVSLFILNLTVILFISLIFKKVRIISIYFSSLAILFSLTLLFIEFEIFKIGSLKIIELIAWGSSKPIYDMRFGYGIKSGMLHLVTYISILAFILVSIFIEFKKDFNVEKKVDSIRAYFMRNSLLTILLIFSLSGFYEFLVRGYCCYIFRANLIHYLVFGYFVIRFFKKRWIKSVALSIPLIFTVIVFADANFKKRVYYNLQLIISHIDLENKKDENLIEDNLGIFDVVKSLNKETKGQDCFYSFQDDAFLQVKLNKVPCTSNPISQDLRTKEQLKKTINELEQSSPNLILFDIDNYSEFYSLGLRVEDNVRSTIYLNLILEYIINNYSPYVSINGYHIWKKNTTTKNINYTTTNSIDLELNMTPREICLKYNQPEKCFVSIYNNELKLYIDVLDGSINNKKIYELMSLDQKHYFYRNFPKNYELSLISENNKNIQIIIVSEKVNISINEIK